MFKSFGLYLAVSTLSVHVAKSLYTDILKVFLFPVRRLTQVAVLIDYVNSNCMAALLYGTPVNKAASPSVNHGWEPTAQS